MIILSAIDSGFNPPAGILSGFPPSLVPFRVGQIWLQDGTMVLGCLSYHSLVLVSIPAMLRKARLANIWQLHAHPGQTALDHATRQTGRPVFSSFDSIATVAVGCHVELILQHLVHLAVGKAGLHVAVVGVAGPGRIRYVQDQGTLGIVTSEEGGECCQVEVLHGATTGKAREGDRGLSSGLGSVYCLAVDRPMSASTQEISGRRHQIAERERERMWQRDKKRLAFVPIRLVALTQEYSPSEVAS